ncbi:MAG: dTDP-glucose 4,6-dehydratase [Thermodesulfobacteriota bacterium]
MQNLLVTGGCGFLGADFVRFLLAEPGFSGRVVNLDKLTYAGDLRRLSGVAEQAGGRYVFVHGDICDQEAVPRLLDLHEVDTIVHFAAESHVDRSITSPGDFVRTNLSGTYVLLQAALASARNIRVHLVSTDEVYGDREGLSDACEDTAMHPSSPYAATKAGAELLAWAYGRTYGLRLTASRSSNVFGPFQHEEKFLPMVMRNAIRNKPIGLYGDGRNVRQWLYVNDHSRAVWKILSGAREGRAYNLGSGTRLTNREAAEAACDAVDSVLGPSPGGPRRNLIRCVADRPGHDRRYAMDGSRAECELGFRPEVSFSEGILRSAAWYADNAALFEA